MRGGLPVPPADPVPSTPGRLAGGANTGSPFAPADIALLWRLLFDRAGPVELYAARWRRILSVWGAATIDQGITPRGIIQTYRPRDKVAR